MQNVFDYNQQADQSLMGGARAERALGIPVQRGLPGSFAPGSSNAQADSLLADMEQGTQDMLAARTKPQRPPVVGYNPDTEEVFSGGKTFKLDLDQGAANAALLDMDNPELPPGFTAVYGDSVKQKLVKEYEGLGFGDAFQRRFGQAVGNVGSTAQDLGMEGVGQSMQEWGGSVARSNPSHINTARGLMESPGQAVTEALGEVAYDVPMAIAQTAVGAKIGAGLGALAAPVTGGASIPLGAFLGGAAGRFIGTLAETYGSVRSEQREAGTDKRGRALAAGSGSAALEALLGPEAAAGNILGRAITGQVARRTTGEAARLTAGGALKYGAKQAGIGAVVEGPLTEVPQSALERWGAEKDLTGDGAMDEYAIGAFKGAVGGAAASPLASVPEFMQAKNFIANLQKDMEIAANPQTPSGERVAAARRAQDVLRGSSEDPLFNEQLQEFRQKLQYIDTLIVDNSTKEAIANGEAVNLLDLAPQRDMFARGDTTTPAAVTPEAEELIGVAQPGQDELFGEGGAPTYGADTSFGVSPFEREQTFEGPRLTPEQRVVAGLPALNEIMDQIQTGTLPRAVSDDLTPGQQAALAGPARPVSGALTPGQQVAAAGPDPMTGFQRALQGVTLDLEAPAAPTPVATVVSSPLQGDLSAATEPAADSFTPEADAELSPDEDSGDIEAELDRVLKAQAASAPGQAKGRVTLPQPVLGAVIRAVRSGRSPVVYRKGTAAPDAELTGQWSDKMRELTDRITAVSAAADKLFNRESNVVPSESDATGKKQGGRALTGADVEKTTIVASDAEADINRLRAALRTAIDNLRSGAGDMDIEALAAVLKTRGQEVRSKDAAKAKADTKLDTTFSRAWAMYKDGALDNIEQADVVRGRAIRESFEQKRKGATNPPLVDAATEGETRRQMRPRKGEATKEFKARVEAAKEKGVLGMLAYLQRHGTAFERLLAASTGRALRRFSGTAAEPKFDWVDTDTAAYYDPKTNTVHVHKEASPEEILHETLHSALQWYVYQNPDVAEVKMLMQALDKVLAMDPAKFSPKAAEVVAVLRRVSKGKSKTARLDAVLELVSYGSTLAEFRNALKQISSVQDADAGTMSGLTAIWQRLTALIQRFLGVSNTVANDVLDGIVALLEMAADPGIDAPGKRKGNILKMVDTSTAAFERWFGDSKVVDEKGKPLVVYHGTRTGGFEVFTPRFRRGAQLGFGAHFAIDRDFAAKYAEDDLVARKGGAPQVYELYLRASTPLLADAVVVEGTPEFTLAVDLAGGKLYTIKDERGRRTAYMQNAIDATSPQRAERLIRAAGYDAVRYVSKIGTAGVGARTTAKAQSWVVFEPTQIKSATGNDGNFDPANGNILKAEVMSGMDPTSSIPELLARPGAQLPSDTDVSRYNKKILPSFLSTKFIFDALGWKYAASKVLEQSDKLAEKVRDDFPGIARWLTYVNTRFAVPVDSRAAFEQYKDDKQAGYKLTERLATFVQRQSPAKIQAIFDYLDGDKQALGDDKATAELADEVVRWRDFYVSRLGNEKASRFFSSGKFSETMLFANTEEQVAGQTFGLRKLNSMLGEKKQVEENLETSWMMLDAQGDPVLDGKYFEVFHMDAAGNKVHDGFMAAEKFDRVGAPAGHMVDQEYVWFHTSFANGKHTFRASMTVKQAVQAQQAEKLSNALRNTMSALANNFASKQFSDSLAMYGHSDGHPDNAVAFDSIAAAEKALDIKIDPKLVLKAGSDAARSAQTQHLYRSPHLWVQLPDSDAYGALKGKLIKSGVWMAMQDMSDRRPATSFRSLNTGMRWFKKAKTVYNPGTHLTNVATNFTLATMHDIPLATVKEAARLMAQYEVRPNSMKPAERQLVLAFINSNAMIGDFSSAEVKQSLYNAMRESLEGDTTIMGRLGALTRMEKAKAEAVQRVVDKAKGVGARIDEILTEAYSAEDNVFRMAAFLKHAADLSALHDGKLTAEDLQAAGDFARWAFLDYDIDAKAVRMARQTVLPFISWTYAIIPVMGKIAVHQPWKIANIMLAFAILEHAFQEMAGGDEEDERLRKAGPEYIRDRMFGVGPYVHIRLPFLGDDKSPVYYRLGDYLPWTSVARGQPNGFMGQEWFPSAITPTGPLVSTIITAIAGVDPYFAKPLSPPTDTMWEKFLARGREIAAQVAPPPVVDFMRGERVDDILKGRKDKPEGFEAVQVAKWFGMKVYSFNEDQAVVAQSRAAKAIMSEFKQEIGRLRRAEARYERPDWERFAERQTELLRRAKEEISELRGE